mmetsp:Transcript_30417/g.74034  ORF Transcript_30417/g.74034 Transcript_30417/m.74034 type:complete len:127 (-) Transcript_30417:401-781(-)|eukprot:CAMPEP_0114524156 /NCGR_PEP_ID=MMETSP0109-20121206/21696_1 /TAXON_ID=29199 /ORGANISM="Chlorarachnion reptans, Strain CCCM449" /LENGTH=126 /DNA_ID=CAMNT_0001705563 /DNA_START=451 /DNA_END=831 /DNA_ORIENTATION=-
MPLKRSQRSRNLSLCQFSTKRNRDYDDFISERPRKSASTQSFRPSFSSAMIATFNDTKMMFAPSSMVKNKTTKTIERCLGSGLCCASCRRASLNAGMYMYRDQAFCSEECRSEAIAIDEIDSLKLQ